MKSGRPQVVAHRGASDEFAEHTLGAYLRALDLGAEALECDVRLSADGHLVCVHDRTLRRTAAHPGIVSAMTLAELNTLDFAAWKSPSTGSGDEHPMLLEEHGKALTLRRLLETMRDYDRRVEIAIETKHPVRYGGLVEQRVVQVLREFGWSGAGSPARVMSFSVRALQRTRRLAPDLGVVYLIEKERAWAAFRPLLAPGWSLGPGVQLLQQRPALARAMAATGRPLHIWTVNTEAQLQTCLDLGATAVISDRPGAVLGWLGVQ